MRLKDIAELVKSDLVDLTEGPFDVKIDSDDAGYHLMILIEFRRDSQKILKYMIDNYKDTRILVANIPMGSLQFARIEFKQKS